MDQAIFVMDELQVNTDPRVHKIMRVLNKYLQGDFSVREAVDEQGDSLDQVIELVNELGRRVQQSGQLVADYEQRVTAIMNVLLKYTLFDFSDKCDISEVGDEIDAIALALNTLGEELNERILSEKKHTEELEKLAAVIETTADAVVSLSPEGAVTHWNKSAERIYGYAAEEMLGKNAPLLLASKDDRRKSDIMLERVRKGEQIINAHTRRVRKDGRVIDISLTMTPIYDVKGQLISISALSRDITREKTAERILKENEERFRSLVEGVKDYAIIMLDSEGYITSWNKGAEAMQGFMADEIIGKHFSVFSTPEDQKKGLPATLLQVARDNGKANYEGWRTKKNGEVFWGYIVLTCLRDDHDNIIGFSKITRDLTENKRKDDEIRISHLRLEQKNVELERINKELASFAYVSSHDLQEPLRKIQTFASRVLETDFKNLSSQGQDYFKRLNASANRMQQLILDILDYSRVSTSEARTEPCSMNGILEEVLEEYREQLEDKKVEIRREDLPELQVIRYQMKQLFSNLLSNSLKFADPQRKPLINITASQVARKSLPQKVSSARSKFWQISFSDNGIGFEPHFNSQIFEVFQRLHNQEVYKGTGIGLAICKKICENHQGMIMAKGELGKGATFSIYLPSEEI